MPDSRDPQDSYLEYIPLSKLTSEFPFRIKTDKMWLESCTFSLVHPCSHQFLSTQQLDTILKLKSKKQCLFRFTTKVVPHDSIYLFSFGKTLCKIGSFSFLLICFGLGVYLWQVYIDWQPGDSSRTRTSLGFMYS